MIVFRIVPVKSFTYEPDEEVPVNSFVVMQRYEVEIVQPQNGGNQNDPDHAELPDAFRNVLFQCAATTRTRARLVGLASLCGMSLRPSLL